MPDVSDVSNEPHITALVRADGTGEVSVDGTSNDVHADDIEGVRAAIIARVTEVAVERDRPVRVATTDLDGIYPLIVHPNGSVDSDGPVIPVDAAAGDGDAHGSHVSLAANGSDGDGSEDSHESDEDSAVDESPGSHEGLSEDDRSETDRSDSGRDDGDRSDSSGDDGDDGNDNADEVGDDASDRVDETSGDVDADDDDAHGADALEDDVRDAHDAEANGGESGDDDSDGSDARAAAAGVENNEAGVWRLGDDTPVPVSSPESEPEGESPPENQAQPEPALIPPPPFGFDDLLTPSDPADGFVSAPTRRSTFQSFEAAIGFADNHPQQRHDRDEPLVDVAPAGTDGFVATDAADTAERDPAPDVESSTEFAPTAASDNEVVDLPAPGLQTFAPPAVAASDADDSAPTLDDFLQSRPSASVGPAKKGWQGFLTRITGGLISPKPGRAERAHRDAIERVQRGFKGPRTIVVLNPKGGAHKTTATLLLAATFGTHRGGSTLAWDNNETRGTLGWRAQPSRHSNTAVDLLRDLDRFADVKSARVGYLDSYVRAQGDAQFDVLASDEDAAASSTIDAAAFRSLHSTLSRFYRVLVIDTGNNMRASNWEAAVEAADQLVVVTTVNEETAASAAWLLDGLRQKGHQDKVAQAVTILSSPGDTVQPELSERLHAHFSALTRVVLEVPYDPGFQSGGPLNVGVLDPKTREAWLQVTAAVADGL